MRLSAERGFLDEGDRAIVLLLSLLITCPKTDAHQTGGCVASLRGDVSFTCDFQVKSEELKKVGQTTVPFTVRRTTDKYNESIISCNRLNDGQLQCPRANATATVHYVTNRLPTTAENGKQQYRLLKQGTDAFVQFVANYTGSSDLSLDGADQYWCEMGTRGPIFHRTKSCREESSLDKPDSPYNITAVEFQSSSITISWSARGTGSHNKNVSYRIRYKPSNIALAVYRYEDVYPPDSTNFTITGLKSGTTYQINVLAFSKTGESGHREEDITASTLNAGEPLEVCGSSGVAVTAVIKVVTFIYVASATAASNYLFM